MAARSSRVLRKGRPTTSAYFDRFKNYSPAPFDRLRERFRKRLREVYFFNATSNPLAPAFMP
jgi:hypothetical protein